MGVFEDIHLQWKGDKYTIKSDRVLGAIARIEQILTLRELTEMLANMKTLKLVLISQAYGTLLRYAGANVDDETVYLGLFQNTEGQTALAISAVDSLLSMMIPPAIKSEQEEKNLQRQSTSPKAEARLSKNTTKRPLAQEG